MTAARKTNPSHLFSTLASIDYIYQKISDLTAADSVTSLRQCIYSYSDLPNGEFYLEQIRKAALLDIKNKMADFKNSSKHAFFDSVEKLEHNQRVKTPITIINTIVAVRAENQSMNELRIDYLRHKDITLQIYLHLANLASSHRNRQLNIELARIMESANGEGVLNAVKLIALRHFYTARAELHKNNAHHLHNEEIAEQLEGKMKLPVEVFNRAVIFIREYHAMRSHRQLAQST